MNQIQNFSAHCPASYEEWVRQGDLARSKIVTERICHVSVSSPGRDSLIVATCSKGSAKRLIAALAERDSQEIYRMSPVFEQQCLPEFGYAER